MIAGGVTMLHSCKLTKWHQIDGEAETSGERYAFYELFLTQYAPPASKYETVSNPR
jgi:hypothetical protein